MRRKKTNEKYFTAKWVKYQPELPSFERSFDAHQSADNNILTLIQKVPEAGQRVHPGKLSEGGGCVFFFPYCR
jgi:hypothetical protein